MNEILFRKLLNYRADIKNQKNILFLNVNLTILFKKLNSKVEYLELGKRIIYYLDDIVYIMIYPDQYICYYNLGAICYYLRIYENNGILFYYNALGAFNLDEKIIRNLIIKNLNVRSSFKITQKQSLY